MNITKKNLTIDDKRLWDSLMVIAKIGPGIAGGNNRQTLTDEDDVARKLFRTWCQAADCSVKVDQMGNMFATRPGLDADALPVYVGSHLDTQPTGGKFDGVLGVLAGIELVRTLNDHSIRTKHPITIVNWTNEEGTRFAPSMLGSGVFVGKYEQEFAFALTDGAGKTLGSELDRLGWKGTETTGARKMHAYFELHIEQGPILEAKGIDIGVVTQGQGQSWTEVTLIGKEAHTGSTPMSMRRNAGLAMAKILQRVDEIAWSYAPNAVGGIGHIDVVPNSRNVLPGKVVFTVDFRSPELDVIKAMKARMKADARNICADLNIHLTFKDVGGFDPVQFDFTCVNAVRSAAHARGYSHMDLVSGAGHDACWISTIAPSAMIMCPCVDGISHNESEEISPTWAAAGADVLLHSVLDVAKIT